MNRKIKGNIKLSARKDGEDEIKVEQHVSHENKEITLDVPNTSNENTPNVSDASDENSSDILNTNNENTLDVFGAAVKNTSDVPNVNNKTTPNMPGVSNKTTTDVPNTNNISTPDVPNGNNISTPDVPNGNNISTTDVPNGSNENDENPSDNNDKNSTSKEKTESSDSEPKKKFSSFTFDLSQDVDHYINSNNDILKALEAVKGRDFTEEEITKFKIWPQGMVLYFIDSMSFDKVLSDKIREYLDVTSGLTGLRFHELPRAPNDDNTRFVFFVNRRAWAQCMDYSHTDFSDKGIQRVIIGYDCLDNGREIAKIIMALLGIPQQHNAPDRDSYVEFNEKAVLPNKTRFYRKVNDTDWLFKDIEYDFRSVTHWPFYKNSIDGRAVLKPLKPVDDINVGETKGFSYSDLHKIRFMYNSIKTKSDEKIQYSNCQKLYKPGYVHKPEKIAIQEKFEENTKNYQNITNVHNEENSENDQNLANVKSEENTENDQNVGNVKSEENTEYDQNLANVKSEENTENDQNVGNVKSEENTENDQDVANVQSEENTENDQDVANVQSEENTENDQDVANVQYEETTENNQNVANVLVYGNERPMGKQGIVQKLSNRMVKHRNKLKMSMKDDPLKWDDVRTD